MRTEVRTDSRLRHAHLELVEVRTLRGFDRNARTHSDSQVAQLAGNIDRFGFTSPVLIDEHNVLIAGHGRLAAAQRLGMQQVPAIRVAGLTEAERRALVLSDNRIALNAGWNEKLLAEELAGLQASVDAGDLDFELGDLGFGEQELKDLAELLAPPPEPEEERTIALSDEPCVARAGETWMLGPHRLTVAGASANDLRACDALILAWERQTRTEAALAGGGMTFKARAASLGVEFKRVEQRSHKARPKAE